MALKLTQKEKADRQHMSAHIHMSSGWNYSEGIIYERRKKHFGDPRRSPGRNM